MDMLEATSPPGGSGNFDWRAYAREEFPSPRMGLGWWRGTLTGTAVQVFAELCKSLDAGFEPVSGRTMHRASGKRYAFGATLYESEASSSSQLLPLLDIEDAGIRAIEAVQGSVLQGGGDFFRLLCATGAVCTRLDVFADFYGYSIDPFLKAFQKRDYSPFRSGQVIDSSQRSGGGRTVYFGTRDGGGSFVRVYEKGAQQMESWEMLRVEYQGMHEVADQLFHHIFDEGDPASAMAGVFESRMDFRHGYGVARESDERNGGRCRRHAWWQQLLSMLPNAEPFDPQISRVREFETFVEWVKSSWPKSMAKLELAVGSESLWKMLHTLLFQYKLDCVEKAVPVVTESERLQIERWKSSRSPDFF